ncbi:DUF6082 family protein [Streptomyces sp. NPDC047853]|uniref:DUF6082 family protein n=1 Tax=unclassified Streptomyces TaxID=2593676 RepID=UPI0034514101
MPCPQSRRPLARSSSSLRSASCRSCKPSDTTAGSQPCTQPICTRHGCPRSHRTRSCEPHGSRRTGTHRPAANTHSSLQANRQVSLLSSEFRAGLLDHRTLQVQAKWLMERELGRAYWREFGAFRESEAKDRVDRAINRVLADEYTAVAPADTVTA